jgi:uncharacterized membrane protein YraQ (UPF0718 family)
MHELPQHLALALQMAGAMFWRVGWSLVLGFVISAVLQQVVSQGAMTAALGRAGPREVALATLAGAASSSCSYAAAAITRTLFRGGAALVPSLAFLLASTNLVAELGIVLCVLMGWRFMAAEWIGALVLVLVMWALVRLTYPAALVEAARRYGGAPAGCAHHHHGKDPAVSLGSLGAWVRVAQHFVMDVRMLWKDLVLGFLIAGALAALVPAGWWAALFVRGASAWIAVPVNALLGPLVAVLSFVCSIGNVPMAAVLWGSGVSFGGVLAFLFADLIVLPLLDVYRRAFGLRMAAYIGVVFYATMVISALLMEALFAALGWLPERHASMAAQMDGFPMGATLWLNVAAACVAAGLGMLSRRSLAAPPACHM